MKKAMKQSAVMAILNTVCIILLAAAALGFAVNTVVSLRINAANDDRYNLTQYANQFMDGSAYLTDEVRAYAATGDRVHYDNYWNEINAAQNREKGLAGLQEIGITAQEQALIDQMSALSTGLEPLESEAMDQAARGDTLTAIGEVYGSEYSATASQIESLRTQFLNTLSARTAGEVERLSGVCTAITCTVGVIVFAAVVLQIISIVYSRKRIIRPVILIEKEMEEIAGGNLSSQFDLEPDTSEIGVLVESIHRTKDTLKQYIGDISLKLSRMARGDMDQRMDLKYVGDFRPIQNALATILDALNHTLGQISAASERVSGGSAQVSQGAQALAQGATEQASAVEELSATISDLSQRMDRVAESAASTKAISDESASVLNVCSEKMDELVSAMGEISEVSSEIGKVIDAIESIAFQTNILALNAAVEAARAGAAGKGFAVVADEVRNLANKSREASKSTGELINRSISAVKHGTEIVDETAQTLSGVVEGTRQSSSHVDQIAENSQEQAEALKQLTLGVNQIADVVQTNSATSEESAAAAQELSDQATRMQELLDAFRLRG